jgi:hypothetical protein
MSRPPGRRWGVCVDTTPPHRAGEHLDFLPMAGQRIADVLAMGGAPICVADGCCSFLSCCKAAWGRPFRLRRRGGHSGCAVVAAIQAAPHHVAVICLQYAAWVFTRWLRMRGGHQVSEVVAVGGVRSGRQELTIQSDRLPLCARR